MLWNAYREATLSHNNAGTHRHTGLNSVIEACKELCFTEAVRVPAGSAEGILLVHMRTYLALHRYSSEIKKICMCIK